MRSLGPIANAEMSSGRPKSYGSESVPFLLLIFLLPLPLSPFLAVMGREERQTKRKKSFSRVGTTQTETYLTKLAVKESSFQAPHKLGKFCTGFCYSTVFFPYPFSFPSFPFSFLLTFSPWFLEKQEPACREKKKNVDAYKEIDDISLYLP